MAHFEMFEVLEQMERERARAEREVLLGVGGSELLARLDEHERSYALFISAVQRMFSDGSVQQVQEHAAYVAKHAMGVAVERRWFVEIKRYASELAMPTVVLPGDAGEREP